MIRRASSLALVVAAFGLLAACGDDAAPTNDSAGTRIDVLDLAAGDCFDALPGATLDAPTDEVVRVACDSEWDYRVLNTIPLEGLGLFPGDDFFAAEAERLCELGWSRTLTPTLESWGAGDRAIQCLYERAGYLVLASGDCVAVADLDAATQDDVVACDAPHAYEAFHVVAFPDGPGFPGESTLDDFSSEECLAAFEDFVGVPYDFSAYFFTRLLPTETTWDYLRDREIACLIHEDPPRIMEGSLRGVGE